MFAAGDFNLDGKQELVTTWVFAGGEVWVGLVSAGRTLGLETSFYLLGGLPSQIVVGDFNNDNSPDLAFLDQNEEHEPLGGTAVHQAIAMVLNMRGTYVSITTSGSPCDDDQPVALTVAVTPSVNKNVIPTGTVAITEGHKRIGTARLSAGQATFTLKHLGLGTHDITAYYLGDNNFNPNWSPTVRQRVRKTEKGKH
jgi:hypothetical protein